MTLNNKLEILQLRLCHVRMTHGTKIEALRALFNSQLQQLQTDQKTELLEIELELYQLRRGEEDRSNG